MLPAAAVVPPGYELVRLLGKGGVGAVYLAKETGSGRVVALKLMPLEDADETRQRRFEQEASIGALLHHPDIIEVYACGVHAGHGYIAMEYLDGFELSSALGDESFAVDDRVRVLMRVALALHHAHQQEIVHRDVKPSNIFMTRQGEVKLLDFGIARLGPNKITRTGFIVGTPQYMSPEQISAVALDRRADVFSLGVVAFELLSGALPWEAESHSALMMAICARPPRPLLGQLEARGRPGTDGERRWLHELVHQAITQEPGRRYASALDMARALAAYLERDPRALAERTGRGLPSVDPAELMRRRIDWALARTARLKVEEPAPAAPAAPALGEARSGGGLWMALVLLFGLGIAVTAWLLLNGGEG